VRPTIRSCAKATANACGLAVAVLLLQGCVHIQAHSPHMAPLPAAAAIVAPPDKATVVFLRHGSWGAAVGTSVIDDHGRYLGDALAESYFAVNQAPGEHVYSTWKTMAGFFRTNTENWGMENAAAVHATLAPGRVYYVEIDPRMGLWKAQAELFAVTPRSPKWAQVQGWLATTTMMRVDWRGGQADLQSRAGGKQLQEEVRVGQEALAHYNPAELEERTLRPEDGVLTTQPAAASPPLPAPAPTDVAVVPPPPAPPPPPSATAASSKPPLPPPGTTPGCKPPTWTDDVGHVHVKPGCQ
jgi:hypothetical protein